MMGPVDEYLGGRVEPFGTANGGYHMKTVSLTDTESSLEKVLKAAQKEKILVLRGDKPMAMIIGLEGYDAEDLCLATSAQLWQLIEARRQGPAISLAEAKARLEARERTEQVRQRSTKKRSAKKRPPTSKH
jgi:PHD/YefM family antitoxin component YafN of YafNO toxin-antitoxin module